MHFKHVKNRVAWCHDGRIGSGWSSWWYRFITANHNRDSTSYCWTLWWCCDGVFRLSRMLKIKAPSWHELMSSGSPINTDGIGLPTMNTAWLAPQDLGATRSAWSNGSMLFTWYTTGIRQTWLKTNQLHQSDLVDYNTQNPPPNLVSPKNGGLHKWCAIESMSLHNEAFRKIRDLGPP